MPGNRTRAGGLVPAAIALLFWPACAPPASGGPAATIDWEPVPSDLAAGAVGATWGRLPFGTVHVEVTRRDMTGRPVLRQLFETWWDGERIGCRNIAPAVLDGDADTGEVPVGLIQTVIITPDGVLSHDRNLRGDGPSLIAHVDEKGERDDLARKRSIVLDPRVFGMHASPALHLVGETPGSLQLALTNSEGTAERWIGDGLPRYRWRWEDDPEGFRAEYRLDPVRGVTSTSVGSPAGEDTRTVVEAKRYPGGVWFPERVSTRFFPEHDESVIEVAEITHADFVTPPTDDAFTLAGLDLPSGTRVARSPRGPRGGGVWDGEKLVSALAAPTPARRPAWVWWAAGGCGAAALAAVAALLWRRRTPA